MIPFIKNNFKHGCGDLDSQSPCCQILLSGYTYSNIVKKRIICYMFTCVAFQSIILGWVFFSNKFSDEWFLYWLRVRLQINECRMIFQCMIEILRSAHFILDRYMCILLLIVISRSLTLCWLLKHEREKTR